MLRRAPELRGRTEAEISDLCRRGLVRLDGDTLVPVIRGGVSWTVDQAALGAAAIEGTYGDTSMVFTTNVASAAGVWIVHVIGWVFSDTLTSCTDNGPGLGWTRFQSRVDPAGDGRLAFAVAYSPSAFPSGTSITTGWTGGDVGNKYARAASFLGGDAGSTVTAVSGSFATSGAWTLSYTTSVDNELVVAQAFAGTGATSTPTGGTSELWDIGASGSGVSANYEEQATAGAGSATGNLSFSDSWLTYGVRITPATSGFTEDVFGPITAKPSGRRASEFRMGPF